MLLWLKKPNKLSAHRNLWTVIGPITVLISLVVSGHSATVYANPSIHSPKPPSSSSLTTSPSITQAIIQAQGRVLIHGLTPPLLLDALTELEQTNPDVNVKILYPITPDELQLHRHIIRTLSKITARSSPWNIFFTRQPQPSSPHHRTCKFNPTELYALIDKTVYHTRYITSTTHPTHQLLQHLYHSTQFKAQQLFLTRFLTCRAQQAAYSIQPYTYQTSSQRRPKNLASQLPKIPKWAQSIQPNQPPPTTPNSASSRAPRFTGSHYQHAAPHLLSPSHNPWHHSRHDNNLWPHSASDQPPEGSQKKSSSNLWYNHTNHDRAAP